MKDDLLRNPNHTGHLLAGALKRHRDKPVLFLGDATLTGASSPIESASTYRLSGREVEDVVAEHPSVAQVCVIGTPDEKWGEAVTAVAVLRPDVPAGEAAVAAMTAEVQTAVKDRKGSVQSPKQVAVVNSPPLPRWASRTRRRCAPSFGRARAVG
jgi:acyl-coenzyme A synthetase/AMP-(fatty) acid ligase